MVPPRTMMIVGSVIVTLSSCTAPVREDFTHWPTRPHHDAIRPVMQMLIAVRDGDIELFKAAYSARLRRDFENEGWDRVFERYRSLIRSELGQYTLSDFVLSAHVKSDWATVGIKHQGRTLPSISLARENDAWRIDER